MRIIVIGSPELGTELAQHLHLPRVSGVDEIASDGFVLDGSSLGLPDARALDLVLRARGAEVEAVLQVAGGDPAVLEHYRGRVIELDGPDRFEQALDGLREVLLAA